MKLKVLESKLSKINDDQTMMVMMMVIADETRLDSV